MIKYDCISDLFQAMKNSLFENYLLRGQNRYLNSINTAFLN